MQLLPDVWQFQTNQIQIETIFKYKTIEIILLQSALNFAPAGIKMQKTDNSGRILGGGRAVMLRPITYQSVGV